MDRVQNTAVRLAIIRNDYSLTQRTIADLYESYFEKKISQTHICRFEKLQLTTKNLIAMEPVMSQFLDALPNLIMYQPVKPSQRKRRFPVGNKPRRSKAEIEEEKKLSQQQPRCFRSFSPLKSWKDEDAEVIPVRISPKVSPVQKRKRELSENSSKKIKSDSSDSGYSYSSSSTSSISSSDCEIPSESTSFNESFNLFNTIPDHEDIYKYDGYYTAPNEVIPDYFVNLDSDYQTIYGVTSIENF